MAQPTARGGGAIAQAVTDLYAAGQSDYGMEPIVRVSPCGEPLGRIQDGDGVIFCCRRGEREVELTEAFTDADFPHFARRPFTALDFSILTLYHEKFARLPVAFAPVNVADTLAEVVSRAGLRQLHIAESEKYAHVTYFFNGARSQPFPGEEDTRIPSPRGVPFEQVPELSLPAVAEGVCAAIAVGYDFIVTNFANGDVIGHTANREAKLACAESIDRHLGSVLTCALAAGYAVGITADHGNLEQLWTEEGKPHVAHTENPVRLFVLDPLSPVSPRVQDGRLADLAPTLLAALGLPAPAAMTGRNLVPGHAWGGPRKVLLIILDGWGVGAPDDSNPIHLAATPVWDDLTRRYPSACLAASGEAVGLQPGKAGNSEAGHINIGAGRVVLQDDVRLDLAMQDGTFAANPVFCEIMDRVAARGGRLHLLALLTEKSSHGSIAYPLELLKLARLRGLAEVYVHVIFDGRSTPPGSAPDLLRALEARMDAIGLGQIVTGVGRGIALDRDGNYVKIQRAYDALVWGVGRPAVSAASQPESEAAT
jgi:2,3-bisphosphoglycerate-independent phosphoglycerate mutase